MDTLNHSGGLARYDQATTVEREKPSWALLAAIALLGVLAFQWPALSVRWSELLLDGDAYYIRRGYEVAQTEGTLRWWVGTWINEIAHNYYRPLVSYLHYFQIWLIDTHGFQASTWFMFGLHAVYSLMAGVLAFVLSQRARVAYLVTFMVAAFPLEGDSRWLSEFVLADNLTTMIFQMGAVACFALYLRSGGLLPILGAWIGFVASVLCKEQGLTTPLLMIVLAVGMPAAPKIKKLAFAHIAFFTAAAYILFKYARSVTGAKIAVSRPISNFWLTQIKCGNWWLLALAFCIIAAGVLAVRYRRELSSPARRLGVLGATISACVLCILAAPTMNLPRGEYALVFLVDNCADALRAIPPLLQIGFLAWLFATQRYRTLVFLFLAVAAIFPSAALGAPTNGIRFLFLLPFVALTVVYGTHAYSEQLRVAFSSLKSFTPKAISADNATPICSPVPASTPMSRPCGAE